MFGVGNAGDVGGGVNMVGVGAGAVEQVLLKVSPGSVCANATAGGVSAITSVNRRSPPPPRYF